MEKIENLILMVVFVCVVEILSFIEVVFFLGMLKLLVSWDILMLEKCIGVMLFKCIIWKIEIMELGLSYYQYCFKILNELCVVECFIWDYYEELVGIIKIFVLVMFGKEYVVLVLNVYLE